MQEKSKKRMKKFYVDMFYNSAYEVSCRIMYFCFIIISLLPFYLSVMDNSIVEDFIPDFLMFFVTLIIFISSFVRKSFVVDCGSIKSKKEKINIDNINYVIITQRFEQLGRLNDKWCPKYETKNGKKIVIARIFFLDEFHFDVDRCESSFMFEYKRDIGMSKYNTLFRADFQQNLLETLFDNGLNATFYIKRGAYEDRRQEFNAIFEKYHDKIKRTCFF